MDKTAQHSIRPKRRRSIIDQRFQLRFALLLLGMAALFAMTLLADYYAYFGRRVSSNLLDPGLFYIFLEANKPLVVKFILFLFLSFVTAILISFRIAGPLFRLRRSFHAVKGGDLSHRLNFRKRDEFHEVAEEFNQMVEAIRNNVGDDRRAAEELAHDLQKLSQKIPDPALKKTIDELRQRALLITGRFQLPPRP